MKVCSYAGCSKELSTSYKLKLHVERHHLNIKRFSCRECLKAFKSSDSLKRHQFQHRSAPALPQALGQLIPIGRSFEIPKLTTLVSRCQDPDLRPNAHSVYIFPFPHDTTRIVLPELM